MGKFKKIIFIDEDNTGFSPFAAEIMKIKLRQEYSLPIDVSSAGVVALFPEPVNRKIAAVASENNINLSDYHAREILEDDFSETTLVLAINIESKRRAYTKFPAPINTYTLKEYVGENGDIRTPTGGTVKEYGTTAGTVIKLIDKLIEKLKEIS